MKQQTTGWAGTRLPCPSACQHVVLGAVRLEVTPRVHVQDTCKGLERAATPPVVQAGHLVRRSKTQMNERLSVRNRLPARPARGPGRITANGPKIRHKTRSPSSSCHAPTAKTRRELRSVGCPRAPARGQPKYGAQDLGICNLAQRGRTLALIGDLLGFYAQRKIVGLDCVGRLVDRTAYNISGRPQHPQLPISYRR